MSEAIKVGMAEYKICEYPDMLTTLGLGSCVGVAIYDRRTRRIGMAHIMLPHSKQARSLLNPAKFADTAIENMLQDMYKMGSIRENLVAKLAGGSQMFKVDGTSNIMKIGQKNVVASKKKLKELEIKIVSEDTGGNYGRTIEVHSEDGRLFITTISHGNMVI